MKVVDYKCAHTDCDYTTFDKSNLNKHQKRRHRLCSDDPNCPLRIKVGEDYAHELAPTRFVCEHCKKTFCSAFSLRRHQDTGWCQRTKTDDKDVVFGILKSCMKTKAVHVVSVKQKSDKVYFQVAPNICSEKKITVEKKEQIKCTCSQFETNTNICCIHICSLLQQMGLPFEEIFQNQFQGNTLKNEMFKKIVDAIPLAQELAKKHMAYKSEWEIKKATSDLESESESESDSSSSLPTSSSTETKSKESKSIESKENSSNDGKKRKRENEKESKSKTQDKEKSKASKSSVDQDVNSKSSSKKVETQAKRKRERKRERKRR
ncbi:hypothetical protein CYY_006872 [Polysphondylium violaceum]|uniref:SWIM-type domain-containing protein n=1 Tax=Polysphondylium violaceum TaxID=133409 RepID=A0A8J4PRL6_9MYCE|nr:hypothetical protein CYY_006872 [Polysphondylium violaceum]